MTRGVTRPFFGSVTALPVPIRMSRTVAGLSTSLPAAWTSSAAVPDVNGVAEDVPPKQSSTPPPVAAVVAQVDGAATSRKLALLEYTMTLSAYASSKAAQQLG